MYTTVYMYTIVVYKVTVVHDKYCTGKYHWSVGCIGNRLVIFSTTQYIFNIRLTHTNVLESMGKPHSCMQFIKSTTSHARICIRH